MGTRFGMAAAGCAAALYAGSLVLPTAAPFNPEYSRTTYPGSEAFDYGWRALRAWEPGDFDWWVLSLAWLANPAVWVAGAAAAAGRWRVCRVAAGCGLVLGLVALPRWWGVVAGLPGYWAWVGSAGLILAASSLAIANVAAEPVGAPDRGVRE